jgi:hypothetical protein
MLSHAKNPLNIQIDIPQRKYHLINRQEITKALYASILYSHLICRIANISQKVPT